MLKKCQENLINYFIRQNQNRYKKKHNLTFRPKIEYTRKLKNLKKIVFKKSLKMVVSKIFEEILFYW